ncbi:hypothetical protein C370_02795 [Cryptococcus neoformans A1-35-8]|nr:hypothetical protein C370_02795 [Cryptococcus neoformans var. grubii A1-35-8]
MAPDITWRTSIQAAAPPNLRKNLRTDGLKAYWERMDQELWDEVQRMRTRQIEGSEVSRRYAEVTPETSTSLCRRTKVPPPPTTAADRLNSLWVLDISLRPSVSFQPSLCLPVSLELSIHALVSMLTTSSGPVQYMSQQYEKDDFPQKINTVVFSYLVPVPLPLSTFQTFQRLKVASVSH